MQVRGAGWKEIKCRLDGAGLICATCILTFFLQVAGLFCRLAVQVS